MSITTYTKYVISNKQETKFMSDPVLKAFTKYRENAYEYDRQKTAEHMAEKLGNVKVIESYTYSADVDNGLLMDVNTIESFLDIVKESSEIIPTLEDRLERINRQITDIEHFIQFKDLNVINGYKIYKKLQERRRERSFIKGKLRIAKDIKSLNVDEGKLEALISLFRNELTYRPRELNFDEMI